jgi:hypothetical protein
MSVNLLVSIFVCHSICPLVCLYVCLCMRLCVCVCLSVWWFISLSFSPSVRLSICPSVYLSIFLSVCLFFFYVCQSSMSDNLLYLSILYVCQSSMSANPINLSTFYIGLACLSDFLSLCLSVSQFTTSCSSLCVTNEFTDLSFYQAASAYNNLSLKLFLCFRLSVHVSFHPSIGMPFP